jgi:cytidylate kinase
VRETLIIAVDGPAASGKGTVARGVAKALGYQYVDTGAMYRAVALIAARRGIGWDDEAALTELADALRFSFQWDGDALGVSVDDEDVTTLIRADDIGLGASRVSLHPGVRQALLGLQRDLASGGGVVMDGRDIGTVVLPNADLKVYLDASLDERARRRFEELRTRGETDSLDEVRRALAERDRQDRERATAPLRPAQDAVLVDSTAATIDQVVTTVLAKAAETAPGAPSRR